MASLPGQSRQNPAVTIVEEAVGGVSALAVERAFTIRDADFALLNIYFIAARLANGQLAVVGFKRAIIGIFDAKGRLLRTVGRTGSGPGEFRGIVSILLGPGDSVHVIDENLRRRTVFDPGLLRTARTASVPRFGGSGAMLEQRLIVQKDSPIQSMSGSPARDCCRRQHRKIFRNHPTIV